jgi:hypothetical protein
VGFDRGLTTVEARSGEIIGAGDCGSADHRPAAGGRGRRSGYLGTWASREGQRSWIGCPWRALQRQIKHHESMRRQKMF